MKKILFIAFLFVSFIANAQISALPKPSTSMPFGLLDVRSFGAVGDSTTDNTTAFRNCFAEAGRLHTGVWIPSGNWVITDSIIVGQRVSIWGVGGSINNNNELGSGTGELGFASTNILMQGNNKSVFVIDPLDTNSIAQSNTGNTFRDFAIIYQGTTPTNNAGIRLVDGGAYTIENISIANFYIDFDQISASYTSLVGCRFSNYAFAGMQVQNTKNVDWGGTNMVNCHILTGKYSGAYAGLYWHGSGAFRMSNCEFNLTDVTHITKYSVVLGNNGSQATQELYFDNTSFSAFDSCAFFAAGLTSLTKGIFLSNIYAYGPITDSCNQAAFQFGSPGGAIQQIQISNITAASTIQNKFGYQPPVISCTNCNNIAVSNITHGAYYTGQDVNCINCNGLSYLGVKDFGLNTGDVDANGQPLSTRIGNKYGVDLWVNDTIAAATGTYGVKILNGNSTVASMDGNNQWVFGIGGKATFNNITPQLFVLKDSNGFAGITIRNPNAGAVGAPAIALSGPNATMSLYTTTAAWTPANNRRISSSIIQSNDKIDMLYGTNGFQMSDGTQSFPDLGIKSHNVGIYNSGGNAMLDIGGNNYLNPNNTTVGNVFALRAFLTQNTTTGVSGTVAHYAIAGFGKVSTSAANTGVTYTNASSVYIDGAPIASTNVTITNPYALYVNAGASLFGGVVTLNAAHRVAYRAITALRTLDNTDYFVNCTANSFTVTLPTAVGITGQEYIIKNTGTATTITIATTSSQTIDGSAPGTITTLVPLRVISDGANWETF